MFLIHVCKAFEGHNVSFALVGGHAVALHGAVRGTLDLDFILRWDLENLIQAESTLKSLGLESRIPVSAKDIFQFREEYIERRNLIAWNFYNPSNLTEQVDLIITEDLKPNLIQNIGTPYGNIPVLSKQALIKMKEKAGREQDLEDIKSLRSLK
jgi:hypothetical protein